MARPSMNSKLMAVIAFSMQARSRYFVKASAGLSVPRLLRSSMSPFLTFSCTHRSVQWRCLMLPKPLRFAVPIAAVGSECSQGLSCQPISVHRLCTPSACAMPEPIPESSASPDDRAIVDWVLLQCLTWQTAIMQHPLLVDCRVTWHPAKSVSQYVSNSVTGLSEKS